MLRKKYQTLKENIIFLYRVFIENLFLKKIYSDDFEKYLQNQLKSKFKNLSIDTKVNNEWLRNQIELKKCIKFLDARYFLSWPVIKKTMFYSGSMYELTDLKESVNWCLYKSMLKETIIGGPKRYDSYIESSGNLIHYCFSFNKLSKFLNINLGSISSIFEFGGGYGGFCRMIELNGFNGVYTIFDLEPFSLLQEYYLKNTLNFRDISVTLGSEKIDNGVRLIYDNLKESTSKNYDLLIGLWSISESPLEVRNEIFCNISNFKYILIAFQKEFGGINNYNFFQEIKNKNTDFTFEIIDIDHLPDNYYLIGKKNNIL